MKRLAIITLLLVAAAHLDAQSRIASDFEIARMKEQLSRSNEFLAQLSGHLNLGDAYAGRSETSTARIHYATALDLATRQRVTARGKSDLTMYSTATSYASLALARLGRGPEAFSLLEDAMRYSADSAKSWNLYASTMNALRQPKKAISAARNAVALAAGEAARNPSAANQLDLAIYEHALATALIETGQNGEAENLLRGLLGRLALPVFDPLRRQIERSESFEVYSTARGEPAAYVSLVNRAQLRLASLLESRGETTLAREAYERVLQNRSDDPFALAALARLSSAGQRATRFEAAFDANPFSLSLIREYQRYLATITNVPEADVSSTGGKVRRALELLARGDQRSASGLLDGLLRQFPGNETLALLRAEADAIVVPRFLTSAAPLEDVVVPTESELRQLLNAADRLSPEQRRRLDAVVFSAPASFAQAEAAEGKTTLLEGSVHGIEFRFTEPTVFNGIFSADTPLRLRFRILGATQIQGRSALLLEPLGLEQP